MRFPLRRSPPFPAFPPGRRRAPKPLMTTARRWPPPHSVFPLRLRHVPPHFSLSPFRPDPPSSGACFPPPSRLLRPPTVRLRASPAAPPAPPGSRPPEVRVQRPPFPPRSEGDEAFPPSGHGPLRGPLRGEKGHPFHTQPPCGAIPPRNPPRPPRAEAERGTGIEQGLAALPRTGKAEALFRRPDATAREQPIPHTLDGGTYPARKP